MTIVARINNKPFAFGLTWVPIQNDKQIQEAINTHNGSASVIRKCPDKTRQIGVVSGEEANGYFVAADIVANTKPTDNIIVLIEIEKTDKSLAYWCVAAMSGKILPGSDVILSSASEAAAWANDMLGIYAFDIYANKKINELLINHTVLQDYNFFLAVKKYAKLKIQIKKTKPLKKKQDTNLFGIVLLGIALVIGGSVYYFTRDSVPDKKELTAAEKKIIIDDLTKDELMIISSGLASDGFSVAKQCIDKSINYPLMALSWVVDRKTIDIKSHSVIMQWKMHDSGFMSELTSIRPHVKINIDLSSLSGKTGTEGLMFSDIKSEAPTLNSELTSRSSINNFLVEMTQRIDVVLKTSTTMPVQNKLPPPNANVVFTPTYSKTDVSINGSGYEKFIYTIDFLSTVKTIKPIKITLSINDGIVTTWSIDSTAYSNNKLGN